MRNIIIHAKCQLLCIACRITHELIRGNYLFSGLQYFTDLFGGTLCLQASWNFDNTNMFTSSFHKEMAGRKGLPIVCLSCNGEGSSSQLLLTVCQPSQGKGPGLCQDVLHPAFPCLSLAVLYSLYRSSSGGSAWLPLMGPADSVKHHPCHCQLSLPPQRSWRQVSGFSTTDSHISINTTWAFEEKQYIWSLHSLYSHRKFTER